MKTPGARLLAVALLSLCAVLMPTAQAQNSEQRVQMKDLPEAVQNTVREQSTGAKVRGFSKEVEDGKTFYEVELQVNGHHKDVLMDATGAIVKIEEVVALASLPPAVKAAIEKHKGKGRIVNVESITKNNALVAYEAHIKTGKKSAAIKVGPDGQLLKD